MLTYTIADSPMGPLLLAGTRKGICIARFGNDKRRLERDFRKETESVRRLRNSHPLRKWTKVLTGYLVGLKPWPLLPYDVRATAFQRRVWKWMRAVPSGKTYSYSETAKAIKQPAAARAVARACATNPVALVIPCHRIVPKSGGVGGYRWDSDRKRQLLELENR